MRYLLLLYILSVPLFFIPGQHFRQVQEMYFQASSIILILGGTFFESKPLKRNMLNISIGVFIAWMLVIWAIHLQGWSILFNGLLGFLVYTTIIRTIKKDDIKFIAKSLLFFAIFIVIYRLFQHFDFDMRGQYILNDGGVPECAFFGIKSSMGMYMATIIPVISIYSIFGFLFLPFVALSYSSGAVLASIVSTMVYFWYRLRKMFWISLIPIIIGGLFFIKYMDNPTGMQKTRIPMWGMVFQDSTKKFAGYGLDSFRDPKNSLSTKYFKHWNSNKTVRAYKIIEDNKFLGWNIAEEPPEEIKKRIATGKNPLDEWDHPHNEFLWVFYELGYLGVALLGIVVFFVCQRFRQSYKDRMTVALFSSLVCYFIFSTTQFPLHLARLAYLLPIIGGFFYVSTEEAIR
jgi:hypothetical protein